MKYIILIASILALISCAPKTGNRQDLQDRIDSMEMKLKDTYKPGFGEFMSSIQAHHAKLWFAGNNQNWRLADFEVHEITETVGYIRKYQAERKESQLIGMINPALDSVNTAIRQKNPALFISSYKLLTNTCNECHRAADFGFNVVIVPETQSFGNQDFQTDKRK